MKNGAKDGEKEAKKVFAVVDFEEKIVENGEEKTSSAVVPVAWLVGQKLCFWPQHVPPAQHYNLIIKKTEPKKDWKTFDVQKIVGYRATYKKADDLMSDSDISDSSFASPLVPSKKRNPRAPARLRDGAESDDITSAIHMEPPPNKLKGLISVSGRGASGSRKRTSPEGVNDSLSKMKKLANSAARKNLKSDFASQSSLQRVKQPEGLSADEVANQLLDTDLETSSSESHGFEKTSTPKIAPASQTMLSDEAESDEDVDDDSDADYEASDNYDESADEEEGDIRDTKADEDGQNHEDRSDDETGAKAQRSESSQNNQMSDDVQSPSQDKSSGQRDRNTRKDREDEKQPQNHGLVQKFRRMVETTFEMKTMMEDFMKGTKIPTAEEFMAATYDEKTLIKYNLMIADRKQQSKMYAMIITLVSHAQGTDFVADKEHLLENQETKDMYKTWMDRLPLKILDDLTGFEEMLKNNQPVLLTMAESLRFVRNSETLRALINALMPYLIDNPLTLKMNLTGINDKFAIKKTFLMVLITTVVRKIEPWTQAKDKDIIECVARWLKNGRNRMKASPKTDAN